jgi:hypothetical protein
MRGAKRREIRREEMAIKVIKGVAGTEVFIHFQYQVCLQDCKVTLNNVQANH